MLMLRKCVELDIKLLSLIQISILGFCCNLATNREVGIYSIIILKVSILPRFDGTLKLQ